MKNLSLLLSLVSITMGSGNELIAEKKTTQSSSSLDIARMLDAPTATSTYQGEDEDADWWDENDELLKQARKEWGRKHEDLYNSSKLMDFLEEHPGHAIETKDTNKLLESVETTTVDGVFTLPLLTPDFVNQLLDELDHYDQSGVPMRRPNGMNRRGAILSELNGLDKGVVGAMADEILRPLLQILFPHHMNMQDISHTHSFAVRYSPDSDVTLQEHADASVATVNICLKPDEDSESSRLYFKERREIGVAKKEEVEPTYVELDQPGRAIIHLGQHVHGVAPVSSDRANLVLWFFGEYGYVRVAPYSLSETLKHQKEFEKATGWDALFPARNNFATEGDSSAIIAGTTGSVITEL